MDGDFECKLYVYFQPNQEQELNLGLYIYITVMFADAPG